MSGETESYKDFDVSKDKIDEISKIIDHVVDNNSKACGRDLMLTQSPFLPKLNLAEAIQKYVEQECLRVRLVDAHDILYALEEISVETDPVGAAQGFIKAWKEFRSALQSKLEGDGDGHK